VTLFYDNDIDLKIFSALENSLSHNPLSAERRGGEGGEACVK